jgi:hypothetical protein
VNSAYSVSILYFAAAGAICTRLLPGPRIRQTWGPELRRTRPLLGHRTRLTWEPVPRRIRLPLQELVPRHIRLPMLRERVLRHTRLLPVLQLRRIRLPQPGPARHLLSSCHAAGCTPRGNQECKPRSQ